MPLEADGRKRAKPNLYNASTPNPSSCLRFGFGRCCSGTRDTNERFDRFEARKIKNVAAAGFLTGAQRRKAKFHIMVFDHAVLFSRDIFAEKPARADLFGALDNKI